MQNDRYEIVRFDFEENGIRVIQVNDEPWFVLKDLCQALEIVNYREVPERLDTDEVRLIALPHPQSNEKTLEMWCVDESGLYAVILRSSKPEAKKFRKWITREVLPSLRKTGSYSLTNAPEAELLRELQRTNQKLDILIKQNEQKKIKKQLPKEPLPDDEKAMIISAICDLAQKNQKVKVSYSTFRNILVSKFGKDVLPPHPTRYLIALAPELEEKKIRLERVGKGLKEQSKSMVQGGFIICS